MSLYVAVPSWIREIPDHLRTQEMCNEALHIGSYSLLYVPDQYETQQMSSELMHTRPTFVDLVSDHFKTQEMCIKAVEVDPYKKRKTQKTKIKEELLPTAWHPTRMRDCCMLEDDKKETEKTAI